MTRPLLIALAVALAADTPGRIEELLTGYMERIARDYHAAMPAADKVSH